MKVPTPTSNAPKVIIERAKYELDHLAAQLAAGMVTTDRHFDDQDSQGFLDTFPVLAMLGQQGVIELMEANPGLIFEYNGNAIKNTGRTALSFRSFEILNQADTDYVFNLLYDLNFTVYAKLTR